MELNARDKKQAANYLALIHATGWLPSGMHKASNWSTEVLLGYTFDLTAHFILKPESLPLVAGHPLLASVDALKAQGFRVDTGRISRYRRWTLTKGVPMRHTEDLRTAFVALDGCATQYDNAEGRWAVQPLGNPGQGVA